MLRDIVDLARENPDEIASQARVPKAHVYKVFDQLRANKMKRQRPTRLPRPEGGISLSEAHRAYSIHKSTLSRWVSKGCIPVLLRTQYEMYLDEKALANVVGIYKENPGQGKRTTERLIPAK